MSIDFAWVLVAFYVGCLAGAWANRKPPKIDITVDPEVLRQINSKMVSAWLHDRGMTWMPKGAVFDPHRTVKDERRTD